MLNDYWAVKSLLLKSRQAPNLLNDPEYQEKILNFLDNSTLVGEQPLWANLNKEQKLLATKYLRLQEVGSKTLTLDSRPENAQLFLVINGSVSVKYPRVSESVSYGAGEVFGSCMQFNEMCKLHGPRKKFYDDTDDDESKNAKLNYTVKPGETATVEAGKFVTMLQITIDDYNNHVLKINAAREKAEAIALAERLRQDEEAISGIPYDQLTEDDRKYINVFKSAKRNISVDIFDFLDHFHLIPRNAQYVTAELNSQKGPKLGSPANSSQPANGTSIAKRPSSPQSPQQPEQALLAQQLQQQNGQPSSSQQEWDNTSMQSFQSSFSRPIKWAPYKSHNQGYFGRELTLNSSIYANSMIFIIEGSVRLDVISTNRNKNNNSNSIVCKRKGLDSMVMKVGSYYRAFAYHLLIHTYIHTSILFTLRNPCCRLCFWRKEVF